MDKMYRIETISQYNKLVGVETLHPLVSIVDFSKVKPPVMKYTHFYYGVYVIYIKEAHCGTLKYGRNSYDYDEGSLVFFSPGQVVELMNYEEPTENKGYALLFHPDLIHGTHLGKHFSEYTFFTYETKESLHISEREKRMIMECFEKITFEMNQTIDRHSNKFIVNNIQLFLDYCIRFYERQFITREPINKGLLEKFESNLTSYFQSELPLTIGLPTVSYMADTLHLSANYFGDLVKKQTGKSAKEYIHLKLMDIAKEKLLGSTKPLGEIANELGFKYSQHFARMFKRIEGISPSEYRNLN